VIDVSVVIVTYNSSRFMASCLGALEAAAGAAAIETIVVDNDSSDDTLAAVAETLPAARIIKNSTNGGFAAACNQGIRAACGRYVLLLNPDATAWPNSIESLAAYMDAHPRTGIAGPQLHNLDGSLQYSIRNFPSPGNQWFESLFLHRVVPALSHRLGEVVYARESYQTNRTVDWVSGAAMILRPESLAEVGLLDERFFMYSEEKDLCYRTVQGGWGVDYVADAHMTHGHEGRESPDAFARQLRGKLIYFDKHYRGVRKLGCVAGLCAGFATKVVAGAFAALVRSERRHHLLLPLRGVPAYLRIRGQGSGGVAS
jgi:GT2 family glycosyltransferase